MASKGTVKPSLHTITREMGSRSSFWAELVGPSDRTCALVGASLIERSLTILLLSKMKPLSKSEVEDLFYSRTALLQTFAAKSDLGHVLGAITPAEKSILDNIRRIRNAFAHALAAITFDHELVAKVCKSLPDSNFQDDGEMGTLGLPRRKYIATCISAAKHCSDEAAKIQTAKNLSVKALFELIDPYFREAPQRQS